MKFLITLFIALYTVQTATAKVNLKVQVDLPDVASITFFMNGKNHTTQAEGNTFSFSEELQKPLVVMLMINYTDGKKPHGMPVFLNDGSIRIRISSDLKVEITENILAAEFYYKFWKQLGPLRKITEQLAGELMKAKQDSSPDEDAARIKYIDGLRNNFIFLKTYIYENPNSLVSMIALQGLGNGDTTIADEEERTGELFDLFRSLSAEVKNSALGLEWKDKFGIE